MTTETTVEQVEQPERSERYPDGIANDGYDYANDPMIQRMVGAGYAAGRWSAGPTR